VVNYCSDLYNIQERLDEELERRTLVVHIFPNAPSCLRLVRALAIEIHEDWVEAIRNLNREDLKEHKTSREKPGTRRLMA